LTGIIGVECLLKVKGCKEESIDSNNGEELVRSTIFSFFFLGKERAGKI